MRSTEVVQSENDDGLIEPELRSLISDEAEPRVVTEPGTDSVLPYYYHLGALGSKLSIEGTLGLIVLDVSSLSSMEYRYGARVYEEVRKRAINIIAEQAGKMYREGDTLTLDEPDGLRLLLFLKPKRKRKVGLSASDLVSMADRLFNSLSPKIARAGYPFVTSPVELETGFSLAIHNPLLNPERIIKRAFKESLESVEHRRQAARLLEKQRLQEIISREEILTSYQSIIRFADGNVLGCEALSRGAKGTDLESPDVLFRTARLHDLDVELDRLCRRKALENARKVPKESKVFVNTLPTTVNDPEFRGKHLIHSLERVGLSPDRIVLEITEKLVIENYNLFQETMAYFTDLGMRFAVDDLGAGYSGLEAVAQLKPAYLKVDTGLVRDIHISRVNQEMIKAILSLSRGIGSTVIAEGIQTEEESKTLQKLGVEYGQGFFLARPVSS